MSLNTIVRTPNAGESESSGNGQTGFNGYKTTNLANQVSSDSMKKFYSMCVVKAFDKDGNLKKEFSCDNYPLYGHKGRTPVNGVELRFANDLRLL